jgi:two-component sensor histidine kinase/Flp pilus assembly protein TadD
MRFYISLLLILFGTIEATAQNPMVDSLKAVVQQKGVDQIQQVQAYTALGWEYRRMNLDSGFMYLQEAWQLLESKSYDSLHYEHDYVVGTLHRYQGDFATSAKVLQQCLAYSNENEDLDKRGRANYALAIAYNEDLQFEKAILHAQKARGIFRELGVISRELGALNVLATILKDIGRLEAAEAAYLEAYQIAEKENVRYQLEPIGNNLASLYLNELKYDKAIEYYEKALVINQENNDLHGIATVQGNIANAYLNQGAFEKAATYFTQAIAGKEQQGAEEDLVGLRGLYGGAKMYLGQQEEGLKLMETNLQIAREKGYKNEEFAILRVLFKSTLARGIYKIAAEYGDEFIELNKKNNQEQLASKVNELNAKYEKAEQDQQITLLSTQNELQEARLSRQRLMLWGGGAILLMVSLLLFAIYRLYRKVADQHEVIAVALEEKNILLKEIHHRVKNNLQVVSSLLNLQSYKITDETALQAIKEGRTRVESMSLIHQTLYRKDNLIGVNINDYLDKLCQSLFETYNITKDRISLHTDIDALMLDVDSVVPLGLIINELITNSLKYAFPGERQGSIVIKVQETAAGLLLIVADDGVGISNVQEVQDGDSFGYELINAFKHKLEADLEINSEQGTRVSLLIRNYQKAA